MDNTSNISSSIRKFTNYTNTQAQTGLIIFVVLGSVFDLGGGLGIKYLSYGLALLFILYSSLRGHYISLKISHIYLFALWPLISFNIGLLNMGDKAIAITQITPLLFALMFSLLINGTNTTIALKFFFTALYWLCVVVLFMFFIFVVNTQLAFHLCEILTDKNMGYFGLKGVGSIVVPGVYFKSTLFFPSAFFYYTAENKPTKAIIILIAIFLSLSKAAIASVLLFLILLLIKNISNGIHRFKMKRSYIFFVIPLVLLIGLLFQFDVVNKIVQNSISAFAGKEATTQVRVGHLSSIIYHFSNHPSFFIFGQGLGTSFYSIGAGHLVNNIELDHLETIRKFGIIWFLFFLLFIIKIISLLYKQRLKIHYFSLIITFILVGTNPLLISPLFLMYLIILSKYKANESCDSNVNVQREEVYGTTN